MIAFWGVGAWHLPPGRGGLHLRGVRRRADVPGPDRTGSSTSGAPRFGFSLPSLEQSERINRGAITLAFPLLTFGLLIGVILSLAVRTRRGGGVRDSAGPIPKVLSALASCGWSSRCCCTPGSGRRCGGGA